MSNFDFPAIDAHVHTYRSREIGRQAMMGSGRTDYGGTPEELLAPRSGRALATRRRPPPCDRSAATA